MKKQLQEFLSFNHVRYLFLAMMLFIGQGLFSQGTITVTTNADSGAGSLRQAIADADSGDVIIFDGAITTITLNSSLELGDSSITIDGGGDVVLHREVVAIDSFRLVTITGAANQVITIKDLTVENGFANGVRGGGIHADHSAGGATHLEGIIFKNNKTNAEGGGLSIKGLSLNDAPSTVTNCQFIENEVLSAGGGRGGRRYIYGSWYGEKLCIQKQYHCRSGWSYFSKQ